MKVRVVKHQAFEGTTAAEVFGAAEEWRSGNLRRERTFVSSHLAATADKIVYVILYTD